MHAGATIRRLIGPGMCLLLPLIATTDGRAQGSYLLTIEGTYVVVRYAPGALDRADHVQRRYSLLAKDYGPKRARGPVLTVDLLTGEDWRAAGLPEPYGLPTFTAAGSLALPAWGDGETVAVWLRLLGGRLPSLPGTPLRGRPEEAASLAAADLLGEVEAARLLLARRGISADRRWVEDLLACSLAVSTLRRYEEPRWPEIRGIFERLALAPATEVPSRLAAVRLVAAAERVGAETGDLPARPLLKLVRKDGGRLRAGRLLGRFPWLVEWADRTGG